MEAASPAVTSRPAIHTAMREGRNASAVPLSELKAKLRIKGLNFYYGGFHALKSISMDIPERKVTAFIGPSGCGKSTLLRTFNRMYSLYPDQRAEGEILMDGENLVTTRQDVSLIRAKIGMVFQKPTPFPMSIYDNIAFGVRLFEDLTKREMDDRVEWALGRAAIDQSATWELRIETIGAVSSLIPLGLTRKRLRTKRKKLTPTRPIGKPR